MNKDTIEVFVWLLDGTVDKFYAEGISNSNEQLVYWFSSEKNEYYSYPYRSIKKFVERDLSK